MGGSRCRRGRTRLWGGLAVRLFSCALPERSSHTQSVVTLFPLRADGVSLAMPSRTRQAGLTAEI